MALAVILLGLYFERSRLLANNAIHLLSLGRPDEALARIGQAEKAGFAPRDADRLRLRAAYAMGDYTGCLAAAERLAANGWEASADDAWLGVLASGGTRPWLERVTGSRDGDPVLRAAARAMLDAQEAPSDESIAALRAVRPRSEQESYILAVTLGRALAATGRAPEAVAEFQKANALRPESLEPWAELIQVCRNAGMDEWRRHAMDELRRIGGKGAPAFSPADPAIIWLTRPSGAPPSDLPALLENPGTRRLSEAFMTLFPALKSKGACQPLISLGLGLERGGDAPRAGQAYEAALELAPESIAARFHVERLRRGPASMPGDIDILEGLLQSRAGCVEWKTPAGFVSAATMESFDGFLVKSGDSARAAFRAPAGSYRAVAALAATTVEGVGAWAEVRSPQTVSRLYVNSPIPRLAGFDVATPAKDGGIELEIRFLNDETKAVEGKADQDRNLIVLGIGLFRDGKGLP